MRVVVVTQDDPIFIPKYIDGLLAGGKQLAAIIFLPMFGSVWEGVVKTWRFFGPRTFIYLGVKYARLSLVKKNYPIPNYKIKNVNSEESLRLITALRPDMIFSLAAPQKFGERVLKLPKYGCFNVHSSLLPKYRGINAIWWAMQSGERESGFTIHKMNEKFDAGPIAVQRSVEILPGDSWEKVCWRVIDQSVPAILNFWDEMEEKHGRVKLKNMPGGGSYFGWR